MGIQLSTFLPDLRNYLINGNMDIWQRGTSLAIPSTGAATYLIDRWYTRRSIASGGGVTVARDNDAPTKAQSGFQSVYSMRFTCTSTASLASGDFLSAGQAVEGFQAQDLIGQKATLSFWAKATYTGTFAIAVIGTGTGPQTWVSDYTINAANTWEKKSITVDFSALSGTSAFNSLENNSAFHVDFPLAVASDRTTSLKNQWISTGTSIQGSTSANNFLSSTSNQLWITQIMLTPAIVDATSIFQRAGRTIQQELAMCQRYYEKSYNLTDAPGTITNNAKYWFTGVGSVARPTMFIPLRVQKRAAVDPVFYSPATGTTAKYRNENTSTDGSIGTNAGNNGESNFLAQPSDTPGAGAACTVHWTVDAEL